MSQYDTLARSGRTVDRFQHAETAANQPRPREGPRCTCCRARLSEYHAKLNRECGACIIRSGRKIISPKWIWNRARDTESAP